MKTTAMGLLALLLLPAASAAQTPTIEGRWKLVAAEDLLNDGTVARLPWGKSPVGSVVVQGGSCYLQIMSTDVPEFPTGTAGARPVGDQMTAALTSTYISYTGPCTVDEKEGTVTLKVVAAWTQNYIGTEQKRYFRFVNADKMYFGVAQGSMRIGNDPVTRRLTFERVK